MYKVWNFVSRSLLVLLLVSLCACATRGENFSSDYSWIREKQTKKAQVLQVLGQPYHVGYSAGKPTWTYGYYDMKLFGDSSTKELKIYWNGDVVDSFSFNSSFPEDKRRVLKQ
ncbi:MAG: hypothetical protein HRU19_09320 [Pseudobacteriovorax sp.]|nr:hypothetical protein [Pseudobacteriovorax sp.]